MISIVRSYHEQLYHYYYCHVSINVILIYGFVGPWCRGIVVTWCSAQLHSTKSELRFCAGSNPACGVSEIRDGEEL